MKKTMLLASLILIFLEVGCDKVVDRKLVSSTKHTEMAPCDDGPPGICYACVVSHKGNYVCETGLHYQCPGHQQVELQEDSYEITYQGSKGEYKERENKSFVTQHITKCQ